jgi:titin
VVVFAVVIGAGTALASSDAREVVSSALGAVARAFGLEAQPRPESHEPDGSLASQPETYVGVPRIGTDVGPVREQESVNAVEAELALPVGPDREILPPTPPIPPGTEILPPIPPDALTALSVSSTQIDLAWNDVVTETGYRIERSLDGETEWTPVGTTGQDVTTFSDVELSPSTGYHYRVFANNAGGDSPTSSVATATTFTDPPSPPDALIATSMSSTQIDLEWTDVATETGYSIERSLDGETEWIPITTTDQDVKIYSDTGLSPGTNYYYRVFATNAGGDSPTSSVASATTATDPPSPPDTLTASSVSADQVDLSWNDVATETGYRIERSLDGENEWTPIGTTPQDVITYRDIGLSPGTSYYYRVIATNRGGDSLPSIASPITTTTAAQS